MTREQLKERAVALLDELARERLDVGDQVAVLGGALAGLIGGLRPDQHGEALAATLGGFAATFPEIVQLVAKATETKH